MHGVQAWPKEEGNTADEEAALEGRAGRKGPQLDEQVRYDSTCILLWEGSSALVGHRQLTAASLCTLESMDAADGGRWVYQGCMQDCPPWQRTTQL